jgi:hypothetical protein
MKRGLSSLQRSLFAVVVTYLGLAIFITLTSSMSIESTLILGVITAIPALVLLSFSRAGGNAAAWASVCMFFWAVRLEAFPAGGGAPMTVVPIVFFGWPSCVLFGAVTAGVVRIFSKRRPTGESLK